MLFELHFRFYVEIEQSKLDLSRKIEGPLLAG